MVTYLSYDNSGWLTKAAKKEREKNNNMLIYY